MSPAVRQGVAQEQGRSGELGEEGKRGRWGGAVSDGVWGSQRRMREAISQR